MAAIKMSRALQGPSGVRVLLVQQNAVKVWRNLRILGGRLVATNLSRSELHAVGVAAAEAARRRGAVVPPPRPFRPVLSDARNTFKALNDLAAQPRGRTWRDSNLWARLTNNLKCARPLPSSFAPHPPCHQAWFRGGRHGQSFADRTHAARRRCQLRGVGGAAGDGGRDRSGGLG